MPKPYLLALKTLIASGLFIALIVWVQVKLDWSSIFASWSKVSPLFIAVICLCVLTSHFLRVYRIHLAYKKKFKLLLSDVAGVSLVHNTASFLLPMRLGEAALPILSKQRLNVDLKYSASALLLVRLFDAHWLLILLLGFASNTYFGSNAIALSLILALTTPLVLGVMIIWIRRNPKFTEIRPLVSNLFTLIMLYIITGMIWGVKLTALALLASELGGLALDHAWVATIIADASALSPITGFANAGTFEVAFTFPLLPLGYDSRLLVNVALNIHILILITNLVAGAFGAALLLLKNTTRQV